ncbi:MAG TPA: hydrogenase maturation protease [Vicinamibacterales bacterium]|nr:hydrogenase maturation protease [Vicinamibacterales bacterium]
MTTLYIGIGNRLRRDDGAALALADRLRAHNIPGLEIIEATDDVIRLVDLWTSYDLVIIADAVSAGEEPGTLHRRDPVMCPLPRHWFGVSSHQLGVAEAIELGRAMRRLPGHVLFIGIEGRDFGHGEGLTEEVERSLPIACELVRAEQAAYSTSEA